MKKESLSDSSFVKDFIRLKLLGSSPAFSGVLEIIDKVADTDAPVLVCGETGTGKELAARAIHYSSKRRERPFIPINCGAIPDNLLESELFGHIEGAFTDAKHSRVGLIAEADGGTLFLDEIEALTPKGQVVLLRFLEDFSFRPVGQTRLKQVNARLVSAANSDLRLAAEAGRFRFDLLYRLAVVCLTLPPLRERGDDRRLLAEHFLKECAGYYNRSLRPLHVEVCDFIDSYDWPGNIRELRNFIHSAFLLSCGPTVNLPISGTIGHLSTQGNGKISHPMDAPLSKAKAWMTSDFEKKYILRTLCKTGGNISHAAKAAGKDRRSFSRLMKKHGIDAGVLRGDKQG
ncbi:MAG: sigma-54-dependent Fis family transcriptional regulator [Deltaproteobacteria bacterium]|nr:sigma-54-dependent Fis family transcriptional regulator [Deltaproteobacteria bacterium]